MGERYIAPRFANCLIPQYILYPSHNIISCFRSTELAASFIKTTTTTDQCICDVYIYIYTSRDGAKDPALNRNKTFLLFRYTQRYKDLKLFQYANI